VYICIYIYKCACRVAVETIHNKKIFTHIYICIYIYIIPPTHPSDHPSHPKNPTLKIPPSKACLTASVIVHIYTTMGYFFVYTTLHHKKGNLCPQCTVCLNEHLLGFFLQTRQRCSTGIWRIHPDRGNQPAIPNKSRTQIQAFGQG
jgi:hypothetical protein